MDGCDGKEVGRQTESQRLRERDFSRQTVLAYKKKKDKHDRVIQLRKEKEKTTTIFQELVFSKICFVPSSRPDQFRQMKEIKRHAGSTTT